MVRRNLALIAGLAVLAANVSGESPEQRNDRIPDTQGAKVFFDANRKVALFVAPEAGRPETASESRPETPAAEPTTEDRRSRQTAPEPEGEVGATVVGGTLATAGSSGPEPEVAPGLRYWIELETPAGNTAVTTGHAFQSNDRIRLHLYSNVAGHIAVYYVGSSGRESRWIPSPDVASTSIAVPAYGELSLPPPGMWLRFDETPGIERLFVIFSKEERGFDHLPLEPVPTPTAVARLGELAASIRGSKDFLWETDEGSPAAVGTYAVSVGGKPLVIEIPLRHR